MKKSTKEGITIFFVLLILMLPGMLGAQAQETPQTPPPAEQKARANYYDFDDILIPAEMNLDKKNSFVYGAAESSMGLLVFSGRVEPASLAGFFLNNMPKDGWKLLSQFKYRYFMLTFLKNDRACIITIAEKTFSTAVEIRVGPIEKGSIPTPAK